MHPINERRDNVPFDPYYFEKQAELIAENQKRYGSQSHHFMTLKLTSEPLPPADLLLCRDGFVHFSIADICSALDNIKESRIAYLLTTTFPNCEENEDITTGDWRLLNLEEPPFNFPTPLRLINEQCSEGGGLYRDKSLGLWQVQDIPWTSRNDCNSAFMWGR